MEACAINPAEASSDVSGSAMFVDENTPVKLDYIVYCKPNWECYRPIIWQSQDEDSTTAARR